MESLDGRTLFFFPFGGANHLNAFIAVYRANLLDCRVHVPVRGQE